MRVIERRRQIENLFSASFSAHASDYESEPAAPYWGPPFDISEAVHDNRFFKTTIDTLDIGEHFSLSQSENADVLRAIKSGEDFLQNLTGINQKDGHTMYYNEDRYQVTSFCIQSGQIRISICDFEEKENFSSISDIMLYVYKISNLKIRFENTNEDGNDYLFEYKYSPSKTDWWVLESGKDYSVYEDDWPMHQTKVTEIDKNGSIKYIWMVTEFDITEKRIHENERLYLEELDFR